MTAAPATAPDRAPLKLRRDDYFPNIAQRGDAVALLLSLPDACTPAGVLRSSISRPA
jgi:hypothetical protein